MELAEHAHMAASVLVPQTDWEHCNQNMWRAATQAVLAHGITTHLPKKVCTNFLLATAPSFYTRGLPYHNWQHITKVTEAYKVLYPAEVTAEVLLAIAYHDCIYVPGAADGVNEELSALTFNNLFAHNFSEAPEGEDVGIDVEFVLELIRATKMSNHMAPDYKPRSRYIARILDCDLCALGQPWPEFEITQGQLLLERHGPLALSEKRRALRSQMADFLQKFVADDRAYIYHTAEARGAWESLAQSNIRRFTDLY